MSPWSGAIGACGSSDIERLNWPPRATLLPRDPTHRELDSCGLFRHADSQRSHPCKFYFGFEVLGLTHITSYRHLYPPLTPSTTDGPCLPHVSSYYTDTLTRFHLGMFGPHSRLLDYAPSTRFCIGLDLDGGCELPLLVHSSSFWPIGTLNVVDVNHHRSLITIRTGSKGCIEEI